MINFKVLGAFFQHVSRNFTADEVKSLNTIPIQILPAESGIFYYVLVATFRKLKNPDGTSPAFVNGAGQNIQLKYTTSTPLNAVVFNGTFLDSATVGGRFQSPASAALISEAAADIGGKSLILDLGITDLTGTGSPCLLNLWYSRITSAI